MNRILHGDCLELLREQDSAFYDSLVTDPPAGISFMGKSWDGDKGGRHQWVNWLTEVMHECLRVLKPGAHGLVWALPRTSHWTATALEDAGFEVRDVVTHLFGTGFPKSLDISKAIDKAAGAEREVVGIKPGHEKYAGKEKNGSHGYGDRPNSFDNKEWQVKYHQQTAPSTDAAKQYQGWGTALKPASEHWILIRKPLSEKTVAANVLKHGAGGINIDGCRIGSEELTYRTTSYRDASSGEFSSQGQTNHSTGQKTVQGRFPANLVLDEEAAAMLDEQVGYLHGAGNKVLGGRPKKAETSMFGLGGDQAPDKIYDRGGQASRFFYVAKASKSDRGAGNSHPTVKSTTLMSYLVRLVTPAGGIVLDPFMGSGSTGVAAKAEGFGFVGIEMDAAYAEIAKARLV